MPQLVLYYFPSCPYCQKVLNFMEKKSLTSQIKLKNTRQDPQAKQELTKIGGKYQVPCLFIDGQPMYESEDIIDWLKENVDSAKL